MAHLEDELERLRREVEALSYQQARPRAELTPEKREVLRLVAAGGEVPDELLPSEEEEAGKVTFREFVAALRWGIERDCT